MNTYLKASLDAFNVSKNCDRSSTESFYNSYVERKKRIISGKLAAAKSGSPINERKLQFEVLCLKNVKEARAETLAYIDRLIKRSINPNQLLIDEAQDLVGHVGDVI